MTMTHQQYRQQQHQQQQQEQQQEQQQISNSSSSNKAATEASSKDCNSANIIVSFATFISIAVQDLLLWLLLLLFSGLLHFG